MNTKLFKLLTAGTFALLSSCGDNVVEYGDPQANLLSDPVQTKATLNVLVRDASSGLPLRASVKLLLPVETADSTNAATGTLSFENISAGEYRVLVEKEGYTSVVSTASVIGQSDQNIFITNETTVEAALYPLTSSLDGYVYYEDANGVSKLAAGATVRVVLTDSRLVNRVFTETVGTDGKFAFLKLPAVGYQYTFQVLEIAKDGQTYKAKESNGQNLGVSLSNGIAAHLANAFKYTTTDLVALFDLINYKTVIGSTETLFLIFSDSIDAKKFKSNQVTFTSVYGGAAIVAEKTVSGDTLKLVPAEKWPSYFTISYSGLTSVRGRTPSITSTSQINVAGASFDLISYKTLVKSTETLLLVFSDSIDTLKFKPSMVSFRDGDGNNSINIATDKIVSGDTLKIVPVDRWPSSFRIYFSGLTSIKGIPSPTSTNRIEVQGASFDLVKYKTTIKSTDTLSLVFSDSIDAKKFQPDYVFLVNANGYEYYCNPDNGYSLSVSVDKIVSGDTLKLVPLNKWTGSFKVCLSGLTSVKGIPPSPVITSSITLETASIETATVTPVQDTTGNYTLDYNSTNVKLKWNKVEGATGYRLYAKASAGTKKEEFVQINSFNTPNDTNPTMSLYYNSTLGLGNIQYPFANGDSVVFLVQAYNGISETKLIGAPTVTVKDGKKPILSNWYAASNDSTSNFGNNWNAPYQASWSCNSYDSEDPPNCLSYSLSEYNNSSNDKFMFGRLAYTSVYNYNEGYLYFNEPIDTANVTIEYANDVGVKPAKFTVEKRWNTNRQSLYLTPKIAAAAVFNENLKFRVQVKGLQDLAGNKFEVEYTRTDLTKKKTNDLEFRFEHVKNPYTP